MRGVHLRLPRLHARVLIYVLIAAALLLWRGGGERFSRLLQGRPDASPPGSTLTVSGSDLAPALVHHLVDRYRRDYPDLQITVRGGGTAQALEDLVNGRADAAFLLRRPSPEEQAIFLSADGDSALVYPVALDGILVVAGANARADSLTTADLRAIGEDGAHAEAQRLYAPDPNLGLWDALSDVLGVEATAVGPAVTWLADENAVLQAVAADEHALGLASWLRFPDLDAPGVRVIPIRSAEADTATAPTFETIALGEYPLQCFLFVACRGKGNFEGSKFVTHLNSARGQREIERAGFLPCRREPREIILTTDPVGATP